MPSPTRLLAAIAIVTAATSVAHAEDWTYSTDFKYAAQTSVRVVEPEGFKVTIGERTDTVPAVFTLPDRDDYVVVRVNAPDGASWEKKIEVKHKSQTILKVGYKKAGEAPKAVPGKRRNYLGRAASTTHKCKASLRITLKMDFLLDGELQKSVELPPGARTDVEIPEGTYQIRLFFAKDSQWTFLQTDEKTVTKDGWLHEYGCGK